MRSRHCRRVAVDSLADLDRRVAAGATSMSGWRLLGLDLNERSTELRRASVAGALFLGCRFANGDEDSVRDRGGIVFPEPPGAPVETFRPALYRPGELYDAADYASSLDARAYAWSRQPPNADRALAMALHDHSVDEALATWISGRDLVGVMGGHALARDDPAYTAAAHLGRGLGLDHTVATGGGPGAMEAANLGGYLSAYPEKELDRALAVLAEVPGYRPDVGAWAARAFEVTQRWPEGAESLGIPTWHYGHEPPTPLATAIAKYFHNSTREANLLEICDAGIVFLPGAAGTVQEIFQDACENYYADESSTAPMVLVGVEYWTREVPVWPLLTRLAQGRPMAPKLALVDTVADAVALFGGSQNSESKVR
jgi:predicted Rossmann-fold nucleotide-binding protein